MNKPREVRDRQDFEARFYDFTAMHRRWGWIARIFFRRYFDPVKYDPAKVKELRGLAAKGRIVYVLHSASLVSYLYFNHLCISRDLPLARFTNGISMLIWRPWIEAVRLLVERVAYFFRYRRPVRPREREFLKRVLREGGSALIFLKKTSHLRRTSPRWEKGLTEALVEIQREIEEPIFLVPHVLMWGKRAEKEERSLIDILFGEKDSPSWLREVILLLRNYRRAFVKVGDGIELRSFLAGRPEDPVEEAARRVRASLLRDLAGEKRVTTGPKLKSRKAMIGSIIHSRRGARLIQEESKRSGKPADKVQRLAEEYLREIAADYRGAYIEVLERILTWVSNNIYDGIHTDEAGLEKVKRLAKRYPIILIPGHRSHIDYLLLSYIFYHHDLIPPHIAAGVNLSFWPLGHIFRHSGAFFIRRSFGDNHLYAGLFAAYVRRLLREGYTQEFFIEGTRSRSGKLLQPKIGMLSMELEAFSESGPEDAYLVPVSTTYERVVEEAAYSEELSGTDKTKESLFELLKTGKILKKKYGRVYIQFGEAVSVRSFLATRSIKYTTLQPPEKKAVALTLAGQVAWEINKVTTVTPSALAATALLTHEKRGISSEELMDRVLLQLPMLRQAGARFSEMLHHPERALEESMQSFVASKFITRYDEDGGTIYQTVEGRRLALDYYKSNILHFFLPGALLANAIRAAGRGAMPVGSLVPGEDVRVRFAFLSRLFAGEFIYPPGVTGGAMYDWAVEGLAEAGLIHSGQGGGIEVRPEKREAVEFLRALLLNFLDSYLVVMRTIRTLRTNIQKKEFLKRALKTGTMLYRKGDIERAEAISEVSFANAIRYALEAGILREFTGAVGAGEGRRGRGSNVFYWPKEGEDLLESTEAAILEFLR